MDTEPTREHIDAALARAKELVERRGLDLIAALAEATTTAQCQGIQGFKVFRDSRAAVEKAAGIPLAVFTPTADRKTSVAVLSKALKGEGS